MWDAWKVFPEVTQSFVRLASPQSSISEEDLANIERYIVILYDRISEWLGVDLAQKIMFMTQAKPMDRLSPSSDALFQHIKRCAFQAGHLWDQSTLKEPKVPDPSC